MALLPSKWKILKNIGTDTSHPCRDGLPPGAWYVIRVLCYIRTDAFGK